MPDPVNVVNPGQSPTPPATNTPLPSGSPASPVTPAAAIPAATPGAAIQTPGTKPPEGYVPIDALHEERNKRQSLDTKLQQLQALFGDKFTLDGQGNIVPLTGPSTTPAISSEDNINARIEKLWEEDPKAAVRAEMQLAFQWYDRVSIAVNSQKSNARSTHPDFVKYESNIDQYLTSLPVEARARPGVVELAYLVVKGQNADEIKSKAVEELLERIRRGESIQGLPSGSFSPAAPAPGTAPTADEVAVANAMGMKIEDYLKYRK